METILSLYERTLSKKNPDTTAIRWVDSHLNMTPITWRMLENESNNRAIYLTQLGCRPGHHVFIFLESSIEIWYFFWAALKCGAVPCVLFPDFGSDALGARLQSGRADWIITDRWNEKNVGAIRSCFSLKKIILLGEPSGIPDTRMALFHRESTTNDSFPLYPAIETDPAFIVFTSGSTGFPKAVVHTHRCAESILRSMQNVLQVQNDDIYWCTAHPAWITGTVYGVIGPLIAGVESVQYSGNFHARRWMPILQNQEVSVWYSAPTAFRSLMTQPIEFFTKFDFSNLREIFSIGEPLNPAVYYWGKEIFQREIRDTWFQTEAGTIRIANLPGKLIKPGYMGMPVDDALPVILDEQGKECSAGQVGRLCLKAGWQSCFTDYFGQHDAYLSKFQNGYYQTGDLAFQDMDGYFCFVGRDDDVINTSGHLVGPFEVESVLLEQPEIAEAGVVAAPDPLLYEKVAAFIVLKMGVEWTSELETRLAVAVTTRLSTQATPRQFIVVNALPKNPAGKILRNELRKRLRSQS